MLHLLFAVSGVAGLIYQVAWIRGFALVFGSTIHSASIVTATFLAGLGIGGWLAGRWADGQPGRTLVAWGIAELGIAAAGLVVALGLPQLLPVSAAISGYTVTASGWHVLSTGGLVARAAVCVVLLAPSCVAMGATLTLLVRHVVSRTSDAGARVGTLYAANTAGAALGALVTETVLHPALGLWRTQLLAILLSTAVGVGGLLLARRAQTVETNPALPPLTARPRLLGALFLAGAAAMGLELVWFRFFGGALGPYRGVFSVLLALLLVGQAVGAALAGQAERRWGRAPLGFAVAQAVLVVAALGGLAMYDSADLTRSQLAIAESFAAADAWGRAFLLHRVNGATMAALVFVPALAMGAAFPLGNAIGQDDEHAVGRRVGGLYLATTAGNVVGALSAGFVLLPGPGMHVALGVFASAAVASALLLVPDRRGLATVPAVAILVFFATRSPNDLVWQTFPHGRLDPDDVLELREGLEQIVVVTGDPAGPARLWTNGHPMTSTTPHAQRYMRAMAHVPLLLREAPRTALVICVGAGNTVHATTLHPSITRVEAVDLSPDVLAVAPWFAHANRGVLDSERVTVFVNDGRHHLALQEPGTYDMITLEPPPLAAAGVSSLYATEFYALASTRLTDDGILAQWLPAYQVPEDTVRSIVRSFVDVFPNAVLLVGSGRELLLLGSPAPLDFEAPDVTRRLSERPDAASDLAEWGLDSPLEIATMHAASRETLVHATGSALPVTDDHPRLDAAQSSHLVDTRLPADLFAPAPQAWCPECAGVEPTRRVLAALFASEAFLAYRSARADLTSILPAPDNDDATLAAIAQSPSLTRAVHAPDALALRAAELWEEGRTEDARRHLDAARHQAPGVALLEDLAREWDAAIQSAGREHDSRLEP